MQKLIERLEELKRRIENKVYHITWQDELYQQKKEDVSALQEILHILKTLEACEMPKPQEGVSVSFWDGQVSILKRCRFYIVKNVLRAEKAEQQLADIRGKATFEKLLEELKTFHISFSDGKKMITKRPYKITDLISIKDLGLIAIAISKMITEV